jgi:DNA-binding PadR family transcriptional regulator
MNLTRLMALGALAKQGNLHGHQIRRWAEATGVGYWGGVSVGALYRELRLMEGEGLVEAIRTERMGRRPARTIYAITGEGQLELAVLREAALRDVTPPPDPLGVALTFAGPGDDLDAFAHWMRGRRDQLEIAAKQLAAEMERLVARGYVNAVEAAVMRRGTMQLETEVRWHDEFAKLISTLRESDPQRHQAGAAAAQPTGAAQQAAHVTDGEAAEPLPVAAPPAPASGKPGQRRDR